MMIIPEAEIIDPIWQNLPDILAYEIISYMDIDTRLAFKSQLPRRRLKTTLDITPRATTPILTDSIFQYIIPLPNNNKYLVTVNYSGHRMFFTKTGKILKEPKKSFMYISVCYNYESIAEMSV